MIIGKTIPEVFAINKDNEIVGLQTKPKQVIPFFYWDCLCEKLGRWPTELEQRFFMWPDGEVVDAVSTES